MPSSLCQVIDQLSLLNAARGGWASEVNLLKELRLKARVLTEGIAKVRHLDLPSKSGGVSVRCTLFNGLPGFLFALL